MSTIREIIDARRHAVNRYESWMKADAWRVNYLISPYMSADFVRKNSRIMSVEAIARHAMPLAERLWLKRADQLKKFYEYAHIAITDVPFVDVDDENVIEGLKRNPTLTHDVCKALLERAPGIQFHAIVEFIEGRLNEPLNYAAMMNAPPLGRRLGLRSANLSTDAIAKLLYMSYHSVTSIEDWLVGRITEAQLKEACWRRGEWTKVFHPKTVPSDDEGSDNEYGGRDYGCDYFNDFMRCQSRFEKAIKPVFDAWYARTLTPGGRHYHEQMMLCA